MVAPIQAQQLQHKLPVIAMEEGGPCYIDGMMSAPHPSLHASPLPSPSPVSSPLPYRSLHVSQTSVTSLDPNALCDPIASSASSTPKSTPSKSVRFSFTSPTIIPIQCDDPSNGPRWATHSSCKKPNHRCARLSSLFLLCFTFLGCSNICIQLISKISISVSCCPSDETG
ncbi:unnamed protein product, partial [Mesorhabditis belari]|uniref:Uncharacterized protein n=1 Tax=Mesorhabditis belari TaxID=2138241 RepID=A0AAF3J9U2_9BILA